MNITDATERTITDESIAAYADDMEACPGCGASPGDVPTDECDDPDGCGYYHDLEAANADRSFDGGEFSDAARSITVQGRRGLKSTPFEKTFKSQAAFEKWLDKNGDEVTIDRYLR